MRNLDMSNAVKSAQLSLNLCIDQNYAIAIVAVLMTATGVSRGISKVSETLRIISSIAHLSLILSHN